MFNWEAFLKDYRINYQFGGKNTKSSNIGLNCPLCKKANDPDPSQHLGINPKTGYWNCWRNSDHSGRGSVRLIKAFLGCSTRKAKDIASEYDDKGTVRGTTKELKSKILSRHTSNKDGSPKSVPMPKGVIDIYDTRFTSKTTRRVPRRAKVAVGYLNISRNFGDIRYLLNTHPLEYPIWLGYSGYWRNNILFPVIEDAIVKTWTARSTVNFDSSGRYKALTLNREKAREICDSEPAVEKITDCLYLPTNIPSAGTVLVVCEGAIDALKVYQGFTELQELFPKYRRYILMATCLFGLEVSRRQYWLLRRLASRFDEAYFLLDRAAEAERVRFAMTLGSMIKECPVELPDHANDPGDMTPITARDFVMELLNHG